MNYIKIFLLRPNSRPQRTMCLIIVTLAPQPQSALSTSELFSVGILEVQPRSEARRLPMFKWWWIPSSTFFLPMLFFAAAATENEVTLEITALPKYGIKGELSVQSRTINNCSRRLENMTIVCTSIAEQDKSSSQNEKHQ